MRLLMTDSDNLKLLAPSYAMHLKKTPGVKLGSLSYVDELEEYYKSARNKLLYKVYPKWILDRINKGIINSIDSFKPDVLWIFKGMEIYPETLEYAKKKGIKLANYNPDHPFIFESRGSGNSFVKDSIPLYDMHFSYSREILKDLLREYNHEGRYLPFGYEADDKTYQEAKKEGEIVRVCFIGGVDEQRRDVMQLLIDEGFPVDVYGPEWNKYLKSSRNVNIYDGVYTNYFWNVLRRYRVQINMFRKQNYNSHNMRSFEIPGIGGIMLAPYSDEHADFFSEGTEAFFYKDQAELIQKTQHILSLSEEGANAIRIAARRRSVNGGYSYADRSQLAYKYLSELIK